MIDERFHELRARTTETMLDNWNHWTLRVAPAQADFVAEPPDHCAMVVRGRWLLRPGFSPGWRMVTSPW